MAEHGYENMCEMDNLNEASILENLRRWKNTCNWLWRNTCSDDEYV